MNSSGYVRRSVVGLMLAALAVSALAPMAQAKHAEWRRYKGDFRESRRAHYYYPPACVVEVHRSSCGIPAFAGFIGGLALGAAIAGPHEYAPPPPDYYYYDPYCHERFASLQVYFGHVHHYHHPRVVRVIEVDTGECVHTYRYDHGDWEDPDQGWNGDEDD